MSSALRGEGVIETFKVLLNRLYPAVNKEFKLEAEHGISQEQFVERLSRNIDQEAFRAQL